MSVNHTGFCDGHVLGEWDTEKALPLPPWLSLNHAGACGSNNWPWNCVMWVRIFPVPAGWVWVMLEFIASKVLVPEMPDIKRTLPWSHGMNTGYAEDCA